MAQNITNNHKHHKCLQQTAQLSNSSSEILLYTTYINQC